MLVHSGLFVALSSFEEEVKKPQSKKPIVVKLTKISKEVAVPKKVKKFEPKREEVKKTPPTKKSKPKKTIAKKRTPKPKKEIKSKPEVLPTTPSPKVKNVAPKVSPVAVTNYESLIMARLEENKYYPRSAKRRGLEGDGLIRIKLNRHGKLLEYRLEKRFPHSLLNKAIARMVEKSAPFPAFPGEIGSETFEFVVPVEFALRK